jgi:hypothetical protein
VIMTTRRNMKMTNDAPLAVDKYVLFAEFLVIVFSSICH